MESDLIRFGPAGNSDSFYAQGFKHSTQMPKWLFALGLNAYEYSFGRGVNLSDAKAAEIGAEAQKYGIAMSVHAPYYINLANESEEARIKSRNYLYTSARVAAVLGASRVIFHPGACTGRDRAEALQLTMKELEIILRGLEEMELAHIYLCPETMGKPNQQGTVDEVVEMCTVNPSVLLPDIDFGHVNALGQGCLKTKEDYERIVDSIESKLGVQTANRIHVHFSHIEYGKSGEVRHLTLEDEIFGPDFAPLAQVLCERDMHPVIICESKDVMAEDALKLKGIYEKSCC